MMASNTDNQFPQITIGNIAGNHISIQVLGRMHAGADDYWDGNWLITPIEVVAGGFQGACGATLRAEEFARFRTALNQIYLDLHGEAVLESMEDWLTVRVSIDRLGHVDVTGRIVDRVGGRNELSFAIEGLDQSDLWSVIEALNAVEAFAPVLGRPPRPGA